MPQVAGTYAITYTVSDSDANTSAADTDTLTYTLTVIADKTRARLAVVNLAILPELARAMSASTVDALNERFEQAQSATATPGAALKVGGHASLAGFLRANARALTDDRLLLNDDRPL